MAKTHMTTGAVIGLSVALLIFASIGISSLNSTVNANTATWNTTNVALYGLIVLAAILGFVYMFLPAEWRK